LMRDFFETEGARVDKLPKDGHHLLDTLTVGNL